MTTTETMTRRPLSGRELHAVASLFDTHRDLPAPTWMTVCVPLYEEIGDIGVDGQLGSRDELDAWAAKTGARIVHYPRHDRIDVRITVDGVRVKLGLTLHLGDPDDYDRQ